MSCTALGRKDMMDPIDFNFERPKNIALYAVTGTTSLGVVGVTYYKARHLLPFDFIDTLSSANPKNFGFADPQGLGKLEAWWVKTWPKLFRIMLRGCVSFGVAGIVYPVSYSAFKLVLPNKDEDC